MMYLRNVTVEDVFLRNNDDTFAIYNHRWWYWEGIDNIHICRATIFNDLVHPFNLDRSDDGELLHDVWAKDIQFYGDASRLCPNTIKSYDAPHTVTLYIHHGRKILVK